MGPLRTPITLGPRPVRAVAVEVTLLDARRHEALHRVGQVAWHLGHHVAALVEDAEALLVAEVGEVLDGVAGLHERAHEAPTV
jgi:hypothetical protein